MGSNVYLFVLVCFLHACIKDQATDESSLIRQSPKRRFIMNKKSQSQPATKSIMYSLKLTRKAFANTKLPPNRSATALLSPRCVLKAKCFQLSSWKSINLPTIPSRGTSGWKNTATNKKTAASSAEQAVNPDSVHAEFRTLNTRKAALLPKPL